MLPTPQGRVNRFWGRAPWGKSPGRCPLFASSLASGLHSPFFSENIMASMAAVLAWALALLSGESPTLTSPWRCGWTEGGNPAPVHPLPFHSAFSHGGTERLLGLLQPEQRGQRQGGAAAEAGTRAHVSGQGKGCRRREKTAEGGMAAAAPFLNLPMLPGKRACLLSRFSCVRLFATPWTIAHQALLSMGFSRQEYWRGLPCPPPGDLLNPGIEPASLTGIPYL